MARANRLGRSRQGEITDAGHGCAGHGDAGHGSRREFGIIFAVAGVSMAVLMAEVVRLQRKIGRLIEQIREAP